jgi:hypothetical protein
VRAPTPLSAVALALSLGVPGVPVRADEAGRPVAPPAVATRLAPAAPDIDLRHLRDIFRYADVPGDLAPGPTPDRVAVTGGEPTAAENPAPRARLIGLVERGGRQAAALSLDGEVVVLGPGESAAGFTVLGISDEAVRLRSAERGEETLPLP